MAHSHSHDHDHHHGHAHGHGHPTAMTPTPHPAQAAPWSILRMTVAARLAAALAVSAGLWGVVLAGDEVSMAAQAAIPRRHARL